MPVSSILSSSGDYGMRNILIINDNIVAGPSWRIFLCGSGERDVFVMLKLFFGVSRSLSVVGREAGDYGKE